MTSLLFQREAAKINDKSHFFHTFIQIYSCFSNGSISLKWHVIIEFETDFSGLVVPQKSASGKAKTRPNPRAEPSGLGDSWPFPQLICVTQQSPQVSFKLLNQAVYSQDADQQANLTLFPSKMKPWKPSYIIKVRTRMSRYEAE